MATSSQVDEFRAATSSIVEAASADLRQFMSAVDWSRPDAELLVAGFMQDLISVYGETAAGVAAQHYDEIRGGSTASGSYRALTAGVIPEQVAGATAWALNQGEIAALLGVVDRLVKQAARDTMFGNVANDSDRRARWIRVPRGDTCAFCLMLASRGYEGGYSSDEAALRVVGRGSPAKARGSRSIGEKFHDFCDCEPVQVYSESDYPANYDYQRFNDIYLKGVAEAGSTDTRRVLAGIRKITGSH